MEKKVEVFHCRIRQATDGAGFGGHCEFVREQPSADEEILCKGTYQQCREAMGKYHYQLVSQPEYYVVQWRDEFSFMVRHLISCCRRELNGLSFG